MKQKNNDLKKSDQINQKISQGKTRLKFSSDKKHLPELKPDDADIFYKRLTVKIFMAIGFPVMVVFCIYHFAHGGYIESFILFLTLFTVLVTFFSVRTKKRTRSEVLWLTFSYRCLGFLLAILFLYTVAVEQNFSRLQWCYLFPIFVAFALGAEEGIIWGVLFFISIGFIVFASDFDFISPATSLEYKIRFLLSFFMVSVILFIISIVRHRNLQELYERQQALKKSEERYKSAFEQNKTLLKEVHHRVKNNLQVMSSLLYLQTGKIYDHQARDLIKETRNRIHSMAIVYETLYQSKDFSEIDMESYAKSLGAYLLDENTSDNKKIRIEIDAKGISLGIDLAVPCCLILQELISNAIKHAFPDGRKGEIMLSFKNQDNGTFKLCLSDNGVGLPHDIDIRNPQSLGFQLVSNLVNQMSGSFKVIQNEGTSFFIDFSATSS
jgi:two-component sensor histidine kinase